MATYEYVSEGYEHRLNRLAENIRAVRWEESRQMMAETAMAEVVQLPVQRVEAEVAPIIA